MRRLRFHIAPEAGWINDPNGPIEWDGRFHVFFQRNPLAAAWSPRAHWGHAVSDDLCRWETCPDALVPAAEGPDAGGCWSGCVVDDGGVPTAIYSGLAAGGAAAECVCLARGDAELRTWHKEPANPVIAGRPPGLTAFRDPFVWREGGRWRMAIGAGMAEGDGAVLAYHSPDLVTWHDDGVLVRGLDGAICECPQYFELGGRRVLLVSITDGRAPSHTLSLVGDERDGSFVPEHTDRFDHGTACYAPATMRDSRGRRLAWAWAMESRDAPSHASAGALTLPRVLSLGEDGRLRSVPAPELRALRREAATEGEQLEIVATFDAGTLRVAGTDITYDRENGELRTSGSRAGLELAPGEPLRLHVFLDEDLLEVYASDRVVLTERIRPVAEPVSCTAEIVEMQCWRLAP